MPGANDTRPLAELLGSLATDISMLFRKEVQLAKTEATENVSEVLSATSSIAVGGVLVIGALGVLLGAIVSLLAVFLVKQGLDVTLANAISAFAVTIVVGLAGWFIISKGLDALRASNLNMNRTAASLGRDADVVKERL